MAKRGGEVERFGEFLERLTEAVGHADRRDPLRAYMTGLLLAGERKSVEPMAAKIDPKRIGARHQSMHHFVATAPWDEKRMIAVARDYMLEQLERHGPVAAWVIDDTGIPKKGRHSVGVARQYCGQLGKQENCQVAVSLSLANESASVPAAYRLYLPENWVHDRERREQSAIPSEIGFLKKWQIALEEIDGLLAEEIPRAPVVADAGYGTATEFRERLTERGLSYAVGIDPQTSVWPPGIEPLPAPPRAGRGRPPKNLRRDEKRRPVEVAELAVQLARGCWKTIRWREGTRGRMSSRFARVRVRAAHRDYWRDTPRPREWLVIEWPSSEKSPTKYWLSTVPESASFEELVRLAKIRWRIERDYQELKDEIGLDHYEGRGWRGFHHHGALCIAAYSFLAAERARLSPPAPLAFLKPASLPKGFRPRGASSAA